MADYWHLFIGALFLKQEAYGYQRDRKDSFAHGLLFIVLVMALVALAGIVGAVLRYAASPSPDAVKNTVLGHLQAMPFYTQLLQSSPGAEQQFLSGYNYTWENFGSFFMGFPTNSAGWAQQLATIVTLPIFWVIGWLIYGAWVHLVASRGAAHVELTHALGTLALAIAPQALAVINLFPKSSAGSLALSLWTLVASVVATRTAYQITTRRAVWAALFPILLLIIILAVAGCAGWLVLINSIRGGR